VVNVLHRQVQLVLVVLALAGSVQKLSHFLLRNSG
jgi:hypothetical protein